MELEKLIKIALLGGPNGYKAVTALTRTIEGLRALNFLLKCQKVYGNVHYVFPNTGTRIGLANRNAALAINGLFGDNYKDVYSMYNFSPRFTINVPNDYVISPFSIPVLMAGDLLLLPLTLGTTEKVFKRMSYNGKVGNYGTIIQNKSTPLNDILMQWNNPYLTPSVLAIPKMYTGVFTQGGLPIVSDAMVFNPNAEVFVGTSGGDFANDFVKYMAKRYGISAPEGFGTKMIERKNGANWNELFIK